MAEELKVDHTTLLFSLAMTEREIAHCTRTLATATLKGCETDLGNAYRYLGENLIRAEITRRAISAIDALGRLTNMARSLVKQETPSRERFEAWVVEVARVLHGTEAMKFLNVEHADDVERDIACLFGDGKWIEPILGTKTVDESRRAVLDLVTEHIRELSGRPADAVEIPTYIVEHLNKESNDG